LLLLTAPLRTDYSPCRDLPDTLLPDELPDVILLFISPVILLFPRWTCPIGHCYSGLVYSHWMLFWFNLGSGLFIPVGVTFPAPSPHCCWHQWWMIIGYYPPDGLSW
jgi:hypothetical protein